jgi:hypothetical protein
MRTSLIILIFGLVFLVLTYLVVIFLERDKCRGCDKVVWRWQKYIKRPQYIGGPKTYGVIYYHESCAEKFPSLDVLELSANLRDRPQQRHHK